MPYRLYSAPNAGYAALAAGGRTTGSSMREVFFLIGERDAVLWSDASNSAVHLPDSRARWEAIWSRREQIVELAHSHPVGPLAFSREDETTMRALVSALGRPLLFSVIAPGGMIRRRELVEETGPREDPTDDLVEEEPWWASLLRLASGMTALAPTSAPTITRGGSLLLDTKEK